MLTLGIETTCDETAISVVKDGNILSNFISSQADFHAQFGGVVPELASRGHVETLHFALKESLRIAGVQLEEIDLIAVAKGPGLIGSLLVGMNFAKGLSFRLKKPITFVNHIEAHLNAALIGKKSIKWPAIGLVVSGGHTSLYYMQSPLSYEKIGETQDDAAGEAFDKVASLLNLPYPGGPHIEEWASKGNPNAYPLKIGQIKNRPFDFSFSGLKTGVLYLIQKLGSLSIKEKEDIAASFQKIALLDLVEKTELAAKERECQSVIIGGGVSQNLALRTHFFEKCCSLEIFFASPELCTDNGAMIASLGCQIYKKKGLSDSWDIEPEPRLSL